MKLFQTVAAIIDTPPSQRSTKPITVDFYGLCTRAGTVPFRRAQNATTATAGGFSVAEDVESVTAALRPSSVAIQAGAQIVIVKSDQLIPTITSGATASWLSETGTISESGVTFGKLALSPKRCSCLLKVSNKLLRQSPEVAELALRRDLFAAVSSALDVGIFSGVGNTEPLGLLFNDSVPHTLTTGGAMALSHACTLEKTLADANAEQGQPVFVSTPATRSKLRQKEAFSGSGPIWTNDNQIIGKPAFATTAVAGDVMVLGNFSDLLICFFGGGIQLLADPFTAKKNDSTEILVTLLADCGPLRPASFVRSVDSAAQQFNFTRIMATEKYLDLLPDEHRARLVRELAQQRHVAAAPVSTPFDDPTPYTPQQVVIFENVLLDPARPVLASWKKTRYDAVTSFRVNADGQTDCGDGYGVSVDSGGPFKVRCLVRPRLGEVKELSALEYWLLKQEASARRRIRFEPVPDDTSLRGPLFPPNFPSDAAKARAMVARATRKPADELSFAEILKWFVNFKPETLFYKL